MRYIHRTKTAPHPKGLDRTQTVPKPHRTETAPAIHCDRSTEAGGGEGLYCRTQTNRLFKRKFSRFCLSSKQKTRNMAGGVPIDTAWLEEGREMAECPVCFMVLEHPTTGCPEGHALCRQCYVAELHKRKECPTCQHATDETRLQRCRPLEGLIGQLRTRCKNGPAGAGGVEGGAPPSAKRAKLEPAQSMSCDDLREELGRGGLDMKGKKGVLAARLEEHRRNDAGVEGAQRCSWRGRVCELAGHLAESCLHGPVTCPNAAAGCKESVLRKDAACHASETCAYRKNRCALCANPFEARALVGHEGSCPEAQIECPNAGCGVMVERRSMVEHREGCGREEVGCPCPGCEERMARADVEQHVEASGAVHVRKAWKKVAGQDEKIAGLEEKVAKMKEKAVEQESVIAVLQKALTRVFTWSTNSKWGRMKSDVYTFTGGLRGHCYNKNKSQNKENTHFMGFTLNEGPECTMHFKCSILDKNDKVLRVCSAPEDSDFREPPIETEAVGLGMGAYFNLTAADKAGAVRADGSIKLRMVVHLYLPE